MSDTSLLHQIVDLIILTAGNAARSRKSVFDLSSDMKVSPDRIGNKLIVKRFLRRREQVLLPKACHGSLKRNGWSRASIATCGTRVADLRYDSVQSLQNN